MNPYLPYAKQTIEQDDVNAVIEALQADIITRGIHVDQYEQAIAAYCNVRHAVAFNSASSALAAACFAADVKQADRFFTTPNSFVASVGPAMQRGVNPIFIDIDRATGNLNIELLEHNLNRSSSRGRDIIMAVHFSGIPVDMRRLDRLVRSPSTLIIEDAAHALGSTYTDGQKVGSCPWSHMTVFSTHPAKTITTGEGGVVTTNDSDLFNRLLLYRNNGIVRDKPSLRGTPEPGYYEVHALTGNYNVTDFQAALGLSQLKKVDRFVAKRRELVAKYREILQDWPQIQVFDPKYDAQSAHHLFVVQLDFEALGKSRTGVMQELHQAGIGSQVHYIPLYKHPYFVDKMGAISSYFPEMEAYYAQALSLPLFPLMTLADVERVCSVVRSVAIDAARS